MAEPNDMGDPDDDHPSQAEGDVGDDDLSGRRGPGTGNDPTTESDGTPVENPSGG